MLFRSTQSSNAGQLIDMVEHEGQYYSKYKAVEGTWISNATKKEGLDQYFNRESGYGAYNVVLNESFEQFVDPDNIVPGDIFYIPTGQSSLPRKKPIGADIVFTDSYMTEFFFNDVQFKGADTKELNALMKQMAEGLGGKELENALGELSKLRGRSVSEIRKEYDLFLQIRAQATTQNNQNPVERLEDEDFFGSTVQLRYGKIVGDALGIDPVFGALLNPTGGQVGPGNRSYQPDTESDIGWHGAFHDAAGYLRNYHGIGPGYTYIEGDTGDAASPYSGQVKGLDYWDKKKVLKDLLEKTGKLNKYQTTQHFKKRMY